MATVHFITIVVILLGVLVVLGRALAGPTLLDRILAVNVIGTKTIVLLVLVGFLRAEQAADIGGVVADYDRAGFFVDIALAYALINFIATIAILRYLEARAQSGTTDVEGDTP